MEKDIALSDLYHYYRLLLSLISNHHRGSVAATAAKEETAIATRVRSASFNSSAQRELPVVDDNEESEADSEQKKKPR
ncbi:hypothetical protein N7461_001582 [Penicillium sp. DV-2018c]|nr:hypothetical protein N7461_001582 [Penicillium sp. DV-2018c]